MFQCRELRDTRNIFLKPILLSSRETKEMANIEKFKWLLKKENIKKFSEALTLIYEDRNKLYKMNL